MALDFNGVSPTEINYNNIHLTSVVYNGVPIWGKPYTLTVIQGENTILTITRTSSPNQRASIGELSNGSIIYHGDVLQISGNSNNGSTLSVFNINGNSWVSGNTLTVSESITIDIAVSTNPQWRTVWNGNITSELLSTTNFMYIGNVVSERPTRVNGSFVWHENYYNNVDSTEYFTNFELGSYYCLKKTEDFTDTIYFSIKSVPGEYIYWGLPEIEDGALVIHSLKYAYQSFPIGGVEYTIKSLSITKVEQYY